MLHVEHIGGELMAELVRVNTRISKKANDWLDKESGENGIPKSTLILLAIENYIREKDAMEMMSDMGEIMAKIENLEKSVERKGLE